MISEASNWCVNDAIDTTPKPVDTGLKSASSLVKSKRELQILQIVISLWFATQSMKVVAAPPGNLLVLVSCLVCLLDDQV